MCKETQNFCDLAELCMIYHFGTKCFAVEPKPVNPTKFFHKVTNVPARKWGDFCIWTLVLGSTFVNRLFIWMKVKYIFHLFMKQNCPSGRQNCLGCPNCPKLSWIGDRGTLWLYFDHFWNPNLKPVLLCPYFPLFWSKNALPVGKIA
jgi:hypothetical protein